MCQLQKNVVLFIALFYLHTFFVDYDLYGNARATHFPLI
jgi:hypothetical protein